MTASRTRRPTVLPYAFEAQENVLLNPLNNHPSNPSIIRWNKSFFAPRGLRSRAASAGDSVSELSAEIAVETAMVSANWRKNVPVRSEERRAGEEWSERLWWERSREV